MFSLTNPWFWGVLVALVLGGTAAGFVKGIEWEQGKNARSQVETLYKVIRTSKTVVKKDNETVAALQESNARLEEELHDVRTKFAAVRDQLNKMGSLPPDTVSMLNVARGSGGSPANPGNANPTVRPLAPPAGWADRGGGKPNDR